PDLRSDFWARESAGARSVATLGGRLCGARRVPARVGPRARDPWLVRIYRGRFGRDVLHRGGAHRAGHAVRGQSGARVARALSNRPYRLWADRELVLLSGLGPARGRRHRRGSQRSAGGNAAIEMREAFALGFLMGILSAFGFLVFGTPGLVILLIGVIWSVRYTSAASLSGLLIGIGTTVLALMTWADARCAAA